MTATFWTLLGSPTARIAATFRRSPSPLYPSPCPVPLLAQKVNSYQTCEQARPAGRASLHLLWASEKETKQALPAGLLCQAGSPGRSVAAQVWHAGPCAAVQVGWPMSSGLFRR